MNVPRDVNIKFRIIRMLFNCQPRDQECTGPVAPGRSRMSELYTVAPYIFIKHMKTVLVHTHRAESARLHRCSRVTAELWVRHMDPASCHPSGTKGLWRWIIGFVNICESL